MKISKLFVLCSIGITLAACRPVTTEVKSAFGTGDSGGGNTFQGKPIESYIRNPKNLPAYKTWVQPIMTALQGLQNGYGHYRIIPLFEYALTQKPWYFIPSELTALPPSQIGSEIPSDQAALQGFERVWINSLIFDKMSEQDQANLILHEILMSVKILKFESNKINCMASNDEWKYCLNDSETKRGPIKLTPRDYDDIRSTVFEIFENENFKKYSTEEWDDLFWKKNYSTHYLIFYPKNKIKLVPRQELLSWVKRSQITGHQPSYAYTWTGLLQQYPEYTPQNPPPPGIILNWKPDSRCDFNVEEIKPGVLKYSIQYNNQPIIYERNIEPYFPNVQLQLTNELNKNYHRAWLMEDYQKDSQYKPGDRKFETDMHFEGEFLKFIRVYEMMCTEEGCHTWYSPKDGAHFFCHVDPEIYYQIR